MGIRTHRRLTLIAFMGFTKILIIAGVTLVALGLLWPWLSQIGLGRLPGDIVIERENFRLYVPITSCLIVSAVISILWYLFRS